MTGKEWLGKTVRVWDGQHASVLTEGKVVAYSDGPVIWVRHENFIGDETTEAHPVTLPIDVQTWVES